MLFSSLLGTDLLFSSLLGADVLFSSLLRVVFLVVSVILGKQCLHVLSKGTALHKAVSC